MTKMTRKKESERDAVKRKSFLHTMEAEPNLDTRYIFLMWVDIAE